MKQIELAWAAGIVDGEGCISLTKTKAGSSGTRTPLYRLILKVSMGHKPTLERLQSIIGFGKVHKHVPESATVNQSFSWVCQSIQTKKALLLLRPYLFTKAAEADVAIEFLLLPSMSKGGKNGSLPVSTYLQTKRERYYLRLRQMKPTYRFRVKGKK